MTFVSEADPVQAAAPASVAVEGDRDLGEYLAAECVTCHQPGRASGGIPSISGRPEADFIAVMKEYRHRTRPNPVMQMIASRLSEEEIASLALYFASLTSSQ